MAWFLPAGPGSGEVWGEDPGAGLGWWARGTAREGTKAGKVATTPHAALGPCALPRSHPWERSPRRPWP